jgi:PQQ-like domain
MAPAGPLRIPARRLRPGRDLVAVPCRCAKPGFLFVGTGYAIRPAWSLSVGPVYYSSPVIGPDGAIHVGNLDGDLIAVRPDGTEKWRVTTPFRIFGSPAVANDGTVYAVVNGFLPDEPRKFRSHLITISADGTPLKLMPLPDQGFTTASPKVWSTRMPGRLPGPLAGGAQRRHPGRSRARGRQGGRLRPCH